MKTLQATGPGSSGTSTLAVIRASWAQDTPVDQALTGLATTLG